MAAPSRGLTPHRMTGLVIGVIAAALGVLLVLGLVVLPMTAPQPPVVTLAAGPASPSGAATVSVVTASRAVGPEYFRVNVSDALASGSSVPMPAVTGGTVSITGGSLLYQVTWHDADGSGSLDSGDTFDVAPVGVSIQDWGLRLTFWLLGPNNATLDSVSWAIPGTKPVVAFGAPFVIATEMSVMVTAASPPTPLSLLKANLQVNGAAGPAAASLLSGSATVTVGGIAYWVNFTDIFGSGLFAPGDYIRVQPQPGGSRFVDGDFTFVLVWAPDASVIQIVNWSYAAPAKPVVTFTSPQVNVTYVAFQVAGTSAVDAFSSFEFNLMVNGVIGTAPVVLYAGSNQFSVGNVSYWLNVTDIGGSGMLVAGDPFRIVPQPGGSAFVAGSYTFYLLWAADGSQIASLSWTV